MHAEASSWPVTKSTADCTNRGGTAPHPPSETSCAPWHRIMTSPPRSKTSSAGSERVAPATSPSRERVSSPVATSTPPTAASSPSQSPEWPTSSNAESASNHHLHPLGGLRY